ncbi:MAG: diguanylate cyclase, partial [Halopseudomonas sp.]
MTECRGKVLVVDDNELIRRLATKLLTKKKYEVATATNGISALRCVDSFCPDVILLDVMMPEMDGFECCRRLKDHAATRDIPVVMVSSNTEAIDKIKGLETGAADYIVKPFDYGELLARVATQVKMKRLLDELEKKNALLEERVKKDSLTNLYNHRYFHERLCEEFSASVRYERPLGCLVCDIDLFKHINDTHGHQSGDEILKSLAAIFSSSTRNVDIACRYGGEEFAFILPHTELHAAAVLGERIRRTVEEKIFTVQNASISVTVSIGVSAVPA